MIAAAILGVVVLVDRMYCRKSKEKDSVVVVEGGGATPREDRDVDQGQRHP